jgi:subtilisin family serine protease
MSWTGADDPAINQAAEFFRTESDGVVVMAGVNGSGFLDYTNQPYIVAVSMTDSADALQSKYGDHIDFSAPGLNVKSTTVSGYGVDSGTSFSTPLVSGLLAMLFSIDPTLTTEQALSVLRQTAVDLGDAGWDQKFGWGRVDFYQAAWLAAAHSAQPPVWSNAVERVSKSNLVVSAEFHPGVDYTLWGKDALESTNWFEVDAPTQTNDWNFEYQVDLTTVTQKFFKVTGEVSL